MKSLKDYICESKITQIMISESLKSDWLQKLMATIRKCDRNYIKMNRFDYSIRWDKVTDKYATEYKKGSSDAINSFDDIESGVARGLAILIDNNKNIVGVISSDAHVAIFINDKNNIDDIDSLGLNNSPDVSLSRMLKKFDSVIFKFDPKNDPDKIIIDFDDDEDGGRKRFVRKNGIVWNGDTLYLQEYAKDNIDRYKRIIKDRRAKAAEDKFKSRIMDMLSRIEKLAEDMDNNPEKYTTTAGLTMLLTWGYSNPQDYKYSIIGMFNQYIEQNIRKETDAAKNTESQIDELLDKMDKMLKEYKF